MKLTLKKVALVGLLLIGCSSLSGCVVRPYDTPEFVEIKPNETGILVPLEGNSTDQSKTNSLEYLQDNLVMSKRVQLQHRWQKLGRFNNGEWIRTHKLIIIDRTPISREWVNGSTNGTSSRNEGVVVESKDSIGFTLGLSITASIKSDEDGVKFQYNYGSVSLDRVLDSEIRTVIESKINSECGKRKLSEVIEQKDDIMKSVVKEVTDKYKESGITINSLGWKGELTYLDPKIQQSINETFVAKKNQEAQIIRNEENISKATADEIVIQKQKSIMKEKVKLLQLENTRLFIDKWDGKMPVYSLGSNTSMMMNMGLDESE